MACERGGGDLLVENTGSVSTIFVESLVDYIPCIALSLVMGDNFLNVVLQNRNKSLIRPSAPRNYQMSVYANVQNDSRLNYPKMATESTKPMCDISASVNWQPRKQ